MENDVRGADRQDISRSRRSRVEYDFVDPVPARFGCTICSSQLRKPHLTECCGQHFCQSCLLKWLGRDRSRKSCPQCRAEGVSHMLNKSLEREIEELQVRCPNQRKGCTWVGEKGGQENHLQSDSGCPYKEVECSLGSCKMKMERRCYANHLQSECVYRPYTCQHCGHKDTFKAITEGDGSQSHYDECPKYPLACPNQCGEKAIIREDLKSHCRRCPLEKVRCRFKGAGCNEDSMMLKDLSAHLAEKTQHHLINLLLSYNELKEKHRELLEDCKKLSRSNRKLNEAVNDLEDRMESVEYEI